MLTTVPVSRNFPSDIYMTLANLWRPSSATSPLSVRYLRKERINGLGEESMVRRRWMRREIDECPISIYTYGEFRNFLKVLSTTSNPRTLKLLHRMSGRCSTRERFIKTITDRTCACRPLSLIVQCIACSVFF